MNYKIFAAVVAVFFAGCSSAPTSVEQPSPISAINTQKLSSSFKRQGIKLEWECKWGSGILESTCIKGEATSIEVTGYATSFGNSEVMRENAFIVAHTVALDKLNRFIKQDIDSHRVVMTMSKNVEKANDRIKSKIRATDEVSMTDDDASKDANLSIRENTNNTVRTVTENIRSQAQGILRGIRTVDESVVDRQTVSVTIRWDKSSAAAANYFRKSIQ